MVNFNTRREQPLNNSGSFRIHYKKNKLTKIIEYDGQSIYQRRNEQRAHLNSPDKIHQSFSIHSQSVERPKKIFNFTHKSDDIVLKSDSRAGQSILLSEIRQNFQDQDLENNNAPVSHASNKHLSQTNNNNKNEKLLDE